MKSTYFLLSIALLASGSALAMEKENPSLISGKEQSDSNLYRCSFEGCEFTTAKENKLANHIRTHMGLNRYKCPVRGCEHAQLKPTPTLKSHIKIHPVCSVCKNAVVDKAALLQHTLQHKNEATQLQNKGLPKPANENPSSILGKRYAQEQSTNSNEQVEKKTKLDELNTEEESETSETEDDVTNQDKIN
jgi:uncharacterized Zn-finger protein